MITDEDVLGGSTFTCISKPVTVAVGLIRVVYVGAVVVAVGYAASVDVADSVGKRRRDQYQQNRQAHRRCHHNRVNKLHEVPPARCCKQRVLENPSVQKYAILTSKIRTVEPTLREQSDMTGGIAGYEHIVEDPCVGGANRNQPGQPLPFDVVTDLENAKLKRIGQ